MFKTVCLLKRKPGMSLDDFKAYYETHHKRFGETYLPKTARFMRRYMNPVPNPMTGEVAELDYDVITETWFENREEWYVSVRVRSTRAPKEAIVRPLSATEAEVELLSAEEGVAPGQACVFYETEGTRIWGGGWIWRGY